VVLELPELRRESQLSIVFVLASCMNCVSFYYSKTSVLDSMSDHVQPPPVGEELRSLLSLNIRLSS